MNFDLIKSEKLFAIIRKEYFGLVEKAFRTLGKEHGECIGADVSSRDNRNDSIGRITNSAKGSDDKISGGKNGKSIGGKRKD
jgi:hypothetical protein